MSAVPRVRKPRAEKVFVIPKKRQQFKEVIPVNENGEALLRIPGSATGDKFGKSPFLTATERRERGRLDDGDFNAFRCSEREEDQPSMADVRWMEKNLYAPLIEQKIQ